MKFECVEISTGFLATISYVKRKISRKTDLKTDVADEMILNLIRENSQLSIPDIAGKIKRGITVTKKRISKLKERGLLDRVGSPKGGYWKILEGNREINK